MISCNICGDTLDTCQEYMVSLPDCKCISRVRGRESLVHGGINFIDLHVAAAVLGSDKLNLIGSGDSMKPFLTGRERLCVEKTSEFQEQDVVLFIRNRRLVAHRVRSIINENQLLITQGDNCLESETVSFNDVIGVVARHPMKKRGIVWVQLKETALKCCRVILANIKIKAILRLLKGSLLFRYYVCVYENPFALQGSVGSSIEKQKGKFMVSVYFLSKNIANGELIKMPDYCEFSGWWLNNLFIYPLFWGTGVEDKLLLKLVGIAQKLGINSIRFVPPHNNLLSRMKKLVRIRECQKWHEIMLSTAKT
jgi:hypothetical protein